MKYKISCSSALHVYPRPLSQWAKWAAAQCLLILGAAVSSTGNMWLNFTRVFPNISRIYLMTS
jgi:hypothetical protein